MSARPEKKIEHFASAAEFAEWVERAGPEHPGAWLKLRKKGSAVPAPTYDEALEIALCFGWIDGQKKSFDEDLFLQSFTPRRARSSWSKRNVNLVAELTDAGRMRPEGQAEVDRAKADGRWERAYEGSAGAEPHPEFVEALAEASPEARAFYRSLNASNRFAIYFQVHEAKRPETRRRRIEKFIDMLERGETLH